VIFPGAGAALGPLPAAAVLNLGRYPSIGFPGAAEAVAQAPRNATGFWACWPLACLLQGADDPVGLLNEVSVGYFRPPAAWWSVKTLIHQRILALSYACGQRLPGGRPLN